MSTAERHLARYLDLSNRVWIVPGAIAVALSLFAALERRFHVEALMIEVPILLAFATGLGLWRFYHQVAFDEVPSHVRAHGWLSSYLFNGTGLMLGLLAAEGHQVLWAYSVFFLPTVVSAWGLACAVSDGAEAPAQGTLSMVPVSVRAIPRGSRG